ncbi:NFACT RNA binding domain-containing protein [uncultured Eubacterium sp.]|uniref:Rqc2 family fibronectin-binding protein n=1 Tax=uncultured Eubacterium sp. TaxID=165185 RepID=UPI002613B36B|nr:NFACT RNA binding domain-containing protein [uncultured Eubacterium sp.]
MAFDGVTISALVAEFNDKLLNGRLYKIAQTESDELLLTIKNGKNQYRLLISANASLPLIYLTDKNKPAPLTAPNFCMLLRKHINNGRIISITQPGLERIVDFEIQHLDELGDIKTKHLIIELMGKHSNIIFVNEGTILDSIKHVNSIMSSVRQVLPGKEYFIPRTSEKLNPLDVEKEVFFKTVFSKPMPLSKAIYTSFTGISPTIAENICYEGKFDSSMPANVLEHGDQNIVWMYFYQLINKVKNCDFIPTIYEKNGKPEEYGVTILSTYSDCTTTSFESISTLLETYYSKKNLYTRMRQKSVDLRKIVTNALERDNKKYNIQLKQLKDTEKKDKFKEYGDLLTTYGYSIKEGSKEFETVNYYNGETVKITLDPTISPIENAKKYFNKYSKLKRTSEALETIIVETKNSIDYLESINVAIDMATTEDDLKAINEELVQTGFIKKKHTNKKAKNNSKPLHFISSDGFDIYVGKNNIQNEHLTFKVATGNDWWFHSKSFPGSHVIVKCNNQELPDNTFEEAARLAAFYSKGSNQDKVEIDYIQKKHVKKVAGAMPGFVIYHTNYSMIAEPNIDNIKEI